MSDLIDRKIAVKNIHHAIHMVFGNSDYTIGKLAGLTGAINIINKLSLVKDDAVNRQDVIDLMSDLIDEMENSRDRYYVQECKKKVMQFSSAQPERSEQPESAKEYCEGCNHIEMCRWYPFEGCEFRSVPSAEPEIIHCRNCKYYYNVLYSGTQFECGKCCRTFTEDVKPDDCCSRGEQDE